MRFLSERWPERVGLVALLCAFIGCCVISVAHAANWPGWRGDGSGISTETKLPVFWSADAQVAWKTALPGEGNSSPIVWGKRIFLTASTEGGKQRWVLCLDAADGHIIWQKAFAVAQVPPTYSKTGYASPTPVTDGQRVYAFFDAPGLVALDMDGNVLWTRALGPFKAFYNMGNSPVLCGGKVVICCDHSGDGFIAAFDAVTGEPRWRTPRKQGPQFSTPLIITVAGKQQIVVNAKTVVAYDPATGNELWSCRGMMDMVVPSAVFDHGLVYTASGRDGPAMTIDPGGEGDVSETRVRMQVAAGGPYVVSPIVYPQLVLPGDDGMMRFIDAHGHLTRQLHITGHFDASPVAAAGNIYWVAENGDTHVVQVTKGKVAEIAVNHLGEKTIASPAIADGRIYLRTEKHLFCIAGMGKGTGTLTVSTLTGDFAALKKLYDAHPAEEGDDVALRIQVVEALGQLHDPAAIALLQDASLKDPHWDVSEAAVKALAQYGEAAVPAFNELFHDWRPYFKVVGAQMFGQVKSVQAVPALLKMRTDGATPVRIAAMQALGDITAAHGEQAEQTIPALLTSLTDAEGVARAAAVRALGALAGNAGARRDEIIKHLRDCAAEKNPLVVSAVTETLHTAYNVPVK